MSQTVREIMTKTVVGAGVDASYKELVRRMHEHRVSAVPIVDDDGRVSGIVSEADLLAKRDPELFEWHLLEGPHRRHERRKAFARTARELMTSPATTIGPDASVTDAAHLMRERSLKHLPVVDPQGRVLGLVSRVDVLASFLRDDDAIADEVQAFLAERLEDPATVAAEVAEGIVRLGGTVELRTTVRMLTDRLRLLDGVVAVDAEHLDWDVDDTVEPVSTVPWVGF